MHGTHTYWLLTHARTRTIASHPTNVRRGMRSTRRGTAHNQEAQQATNTCTRESLPEPMIHRREPRRAHQHKKPSDKRAREAQFGATDRDRAMPLPIHKVHQDRDPSRWRRCRRLAAVCCSTHHDGLHERSSLDGSRHRWTSGRARSSSASPPSCQTQKQRRHGGQRDEDPSSQRQDPAFKRSFLPHSPPSLSLDFGHWEERQGRR